jgi:hypothetical protein
MLANDVIFGTGTGIPGVVVTVTVTRSTGGESRTDTLT